MLISFDQRLKAQITRRDQALKRLESEGRMARARVSETVEQVGAQVSPAKFVRAHPWGAFLGAAATGLALAALWRAWISAAAKPQPVIQAGGPAPQKVVIEVVGAERQRTSVVDGPLLQALVAGMPVALAFLRTHFAGAAGDGAANPGVAASHTVEHGNGGSHPAISRRTAPPPAL